MLECENVNNKKSNVKRKSILLMSSKNKLPYSPPELDVYHYVVEKGFADTPVRSTARTETFSEINEIGSSTGGENQTGTWGTGIDW